MKTFKQLHEALGDKAKNFEEDIVNLINYCVENDVTPKEGITKINITGSGSANELEQTVQNVYDKITPTQAIHSANYYKLKSNYTESGTNQDKADIIIVSGETWMPTSVKLSGGIVIASTQAKEEYRGIFYSALERYEKNENAKINNEIKEIIDRVQQNAIAELYSRTSLTPGGMKSFKDKLTKANKRLEIEGRPKTKKELDDAANEIKNFIDESIETPYEQIEQSLKVLKKEFQSIINNNEILNRYIAFEGLTAYSKYNSNGVSPADNTEFETNSKPSISAPYAKFILSPDGFDEIENPYSKYVTGAMRESKFGIRGLPDGIPRSGGAKAVDNAYEYLTGNQNVKQTFDKLNKIKVNFKYDSDTRKIHKQMKNLEEEIILEFKWFNNMKNKIKQFFIKFVGFFRNFFAILKSKSTSELIDLLKFDITGTIKTP